MKTPTTQPTTENTRRAYRFLLAFAGVTPAKFRTECEWSIREERDGEGEGEPTPAEWLRAAREVAWDLVTKGGRDQVAERSFARASENVALILAGAL